jgi:hypothetical protein
LPPPVHPLYATHGLAEVRLETEALPIGLEVLDDLISSECSPNL